MKPIAALRAWLTTTLPPISDRMAPPVKHPERLNHVPPERRRGEEDIDPITVAFLEARRAGYDVMPFATVGRRIA